MQTASQVLRDAKALIGTPDKWCKKDWIAGGARCSYGALYTVMCGDATIPASYDGQTGPIRYLHSAIWENPFHYCRGIATFNDLKTTTHADVMAAFDRAIALAEADERKNAPWTQADTMRVIDGIVSTADGTRLDSSTVGAE